VRAEGEREDSKAPHSSKRRIMKTWEEDAHAKHGGEERADTDTDTDTDRHRDRHGAHRALWPASEGKFSLLPSDIGSSMRPPELEHEHAVHPLLTLRHDLHCLQKFILAHLHRTAHRTPATNDLVSLALPSSRLPTDLPCRVTLPGLASCLGPTLNMGKCAWGISGGMKATARVLRRGVVDADVAATGSAGGRLLSGLLGNSQ
jgi:hypothetical protein